jgi:hypothetical protein
VSAVAHLPAPKTNGQETVELVCPSGHRTTHSLARVLRLNDGWCGRCGVGISYEPQADAAAAKAGKVRAVSDSGAEALSRSTG